LPLQLPFWLSPQGICCCLFLFLFLLQFVVLFLLQLLLLLLLLLPLSVLITTRNNRLGAPSSARLYRA
jgi:hypothetical protein